MHLDSDACYRALTARDARFDGVFFVGVTTTGIYCRPVCRAKTPGRDRCQFFRAAAEAERGGFRACFRCRPERAPGGSSVDAVSRVVADAFRRIQQGALDESSVASLAKELGVTDRHLRRAMEQEMGVSPKELASSRRIALARQLVMETRLPLTEVAFASGFSSLRRFQAAFRASFERAPSELRRSTATRTAGLGSRNPGVSLTLETRAPLAIEPLFRFLGARATRGIDAVDATGHRRSMRVGDRVGWIVVSRASASSLLLEVSPTLVPVVADVVSRVRHLYDLDAHPATIDAHLAADPLLRPCVARAPGLRVPGAVDGFEIAVRVILGQQISVRAATTIAGRIAAAFGDPVDTPWPDVTRVPPTAARLAGAGVEALQALGLTRARAATVVAVARAVAQGDLRLDSGCDPERVLAALLAIPGVGPWTAELVAMRALHWPDAFPHADLGLRRALGATDRRAMLERAERWRPWRSYAVMHLWAKDGGGG